MREILFKAKRIDNGKWVEGWIVPTMQNTYHYGYRIIETCGINYDELDFWEPSFISWEVDENTLCQYTGLTDKNGNKIWENDIVKKHFYTDYDAFANSEEYFGVVKFTDYAWVIETKRDNRVCVRPIIESISYSEDVKHFEVIGNSFDNPELLKGGAE